MAAAVALPFEGLPTVWVVLFTVAFALICAMLAWTTLLFVRGQRARRRPPPARAGLSAGFTWVVIVPALNEEVTIGDSVARLLDLPLERLHVVVVDDGSDDATPEVLAGLARPGLHVLRREPPDAQQGKAAALNHGYQALGEILGVPASDPDAVIVTVVDADGRLHFGRSGLRGRPLRRPGRGRRPVARPHLQPQPSADLAAGRRVLGLPLPLPGGTNGLGHGRHGRERAVQPVVSATGDRRPHRALARPSHRVPGSRAPARRGRLARSSGASRGRRSAGASRPAATVQAAHPLVPGQPAGDRADGIGGPGTAAAAGKDGAARLPADAALADHRRGDARRRRRARADWRGGFLDAGPWWQLIFFYLLGFGGVILGCVARGARHGPRGLATGYLVAHPYAVYTWMLWPVLVRSVLRQLTERRGWAKTEREPLADRALSRPG